MQHQLCFCQDQATLNHVQTLLNEGWQLDPAYDSKPLRLDCAVIFPLIKYESEDEQPTPVDETKPGEFDDVESLRDVPNAEVDSLLKEGYVIYQIFSKNTILIKHKKPQEVFVGTTTLEAAEIVSVKDVRELES